MIPESKIRDAIDVVLACDLSDTVFGNAMMAQAHSLAGQPRDRLRASPRGIAPVCDPSSQLSCAARAARPDALVAPTPVPVPKSLTALGAATRRRVRRAGTTLSVCQERTPACRRRSRSGTRPTTYPLQESGRSQARIYQTPANARVRKQWVNLARDPRCRTLEHVIWIGLDYPNLLLTL